MANLKARGCAAAIVTAGDGPAGQSLNGVTRTRWAGQWTTARPLDLPRRH